MDGVGNGPYGWTMGDVGGMEDMDWVVNKMGAGWEMWHIFWIEGVRYKVEGVVLEVGCTIPFTNYEKLIWIKKVLFTHFFHQYFQTQIRCSNLRNAESRLDFHLMASSFTYLLLMRSYSLLPFLRDLNNSQYQPHFLQRGHLKSQILKRER